LKPLTGHAILAAIIAVFAAVPSYAKRDFGPHRGYLISIEGEREKKIEELILFSPPPPLKPPLRERIFNAKLSKEFTEKYEDKFGRTEEERIYYAPNRDTYYNDVYGLHGTPQEISNQRRDFANFMVRRLAEFHLDDYMKNDPDARPLYEVKERISNVRVEVQKFRFDMQYSIAGNTFDLNVISPYLDQSKLRLEFDPAAIGPTQIQESRLTLGRKITKTIGLETHYTFTEGVLSLVGSKTYTANFSSSLTASTFTNDSKKSTRESLYLAGIAYAF
jgi:hypothetical protein